MNTRLKQFLAAENISQAYFADTINVVRASVSHVLAGRNNPSYDFIKAIMDNYPKLNIEWLILGKGKMYKENPASPTQDEAQQDELDSGLLFTDETDDLIPVDPDIPLLVDTHRPNIASSNELNASSDPSQMPMKQRKVSRIIVLFDDGTFQEM